MHSCFTGLLMETRRLFTNWLHPSKHLTLIYEHNFLLRTIDHKWYSIIVTIRPPFHFFFSILVQRSYILACMTNRNRNASTGTFLRGLRTEAWIIHPFEGIRWLYYSFSADFNVFSGRKGVPFTSQYLTRSSRKVDTRTLRPLCNYEV